MIWCRKIWCFNDPWCSQVMHVKGRAAKISRRLFQSAMIVSACVIDFIHAFLLRARSRFSCMFSTDVRCDNPSPGTTRRLYSAPNFGGRRCRVSTKAAVGLLPVASGLSPMHTMPCAHVDIDDPMAESRTTSFQEPRAIFFECCSDLSALWRHFSRSSDCEWLFFMGRLVTVLVIWTL